MQRITTGFFLASSVESPGTEEDPGWGKSEKVADILATSFQLLFKEEEHNNQQWLEEHLHSPPIATYSILRRNAVRKRGPLELVSAKTNP